jgi:hypothetical protein
MTLPRARGRDACCRHFDPSSIVVHEGSLHYVIEEPEMEEHLLVPGSPGIVEPQLAHHVVIDAPMRFCVEFHR